MAGALVSGLARESWPNGRFADEPKDLWAARLELGTRAFGDLEMENGLTDWIDPLTYQEWLHGWGRIQG